MANEIWGKINGRYLVMITQVFNLDGHGLPHTGRIKAWRNTSELSVEGEN